mmetsp:Transcript_4087/g.13782  ORF Transcript_4087/g.13782 Transcript_4087/m.13782 type:complete len:227 (+) Transcript_4087:460-1140(+)
MPPPPLRPRTAEPWGLPQDTPMGPPASKARPAPAPMPPRSSMPLLSSTRAARTAAAPRPRPRERPRPRPRRRRLRRPRPGIRAEGDGAPRAQAPSEGTWWRRPRRRGSRRSTAWTVPPRRARRASATTPSGRSPMPPSKMGARAASSPSSRGTPARRARTGDAVRRGALPSARQQREFRSRFVEHSQTLEFPNDLLGTRSSWLGCQIQLGGSRNRRQYACFEHGGK